MQNQETKIVDLVNLCKTDNQQFLKLFEESHKIYSEAFPKHEQESKGQILGYIEESADSLGISKNIGNYNYLVPVVDGISKGMHSLDFISNNKGDLVAHLGPLAIGKDARSKGLSSILVNTIFEKVKAYSNQEQLNPLGLIGDVNTFNYPEEVNKYSARLNFHHNHLGFGAAITIDKNNNAKLVPYASPGIIKDGQPADIMPFIMAITPFVEDSIKKISASPGKIISPNGKVIVDKNSLQRISPERMMEMQKMIFSNYAESPEIYDLKQISDIIDQSKKVLDDVDETYLVPIMDTRYLK